MVVITVDDAEIIRRMSGRRVHLESGRTYHVEFNPPREEGKDDVTGEALIQRDDDQEATVRERLRVFHEQTAPLIDFYTRLSRDDAARAPRYVSVEGVAPVEQVREEVLSALEQIA